MDCSTTPCPPSPGVCPSSCPLNQWCYPTISSSAALFSFCLQSFSASGFFPMSQMFTSHGQSIGASASASVLPTDSQESSPAPQFFSAQPSLWSNSHIHTWLKKTYITLTIQIFVGKVMSLLLICCLGLSLLSFQGANIFNFMAAVTVHSDFGGKESTCQCRGRRQQRMVVR